VVPADTKPDLMHAIERRAQGYEVLPNPQYLRKFNKGPNEKLSLDAKVMTPEQFFGFSTTAPVDAAGNARTPLSFHSLDRGLGNLAGPDADAVRRATTAIAEGKPAEPGDLAEIQRLVSNGDLEPASLPSSVRDQLSAPPDKVVGIENRGGPYKDARNDPSLPHEYLDRRQLLPYRRMGAVSSWKTAEKALKRGAVSVCIGNKINTADEGHALLQRLSAGDVTALHDLGVSEVPDKFDPSSREWALVEGRDGFAIYSGKIDKVSVPADVRIIGHNHPGPQPGQVEGRLIKDLPASVNGKTYGEIIADPEAAKDAGIVPSIADIHAISEGNDHVLYTRYVHEGNGRIGNPTGTAEPLVSIHLSDTKVVRWNERTKDYWYQVSVEVKDAQGNTLWSGTMWGEWHAQIQNGTVHLRTPPALQRPLPAGWKEP
jgi:hypothetical protein